METCKDPISVRVARINSEILGKNAKFNYSSLLSREALLDTLAALYEECSLESLQKYDSNIANFIEKYKENVKEIKQLRVNLSDFEIKDVIGRGHFGEVHLVKEKQTGDVYAMKTLRKFDNDLKNLSFEEERDIMAYSNSNWLTSLQYAFQDSTYLFFVMEYHPGGDLLGLLYRQGGTLPESAATFYLAETVLALQDLHKMGYIHRDIKPDNILLDRCGHLKLADFGSAAKLNKEGFVTAGPPVGTPDYVAPEVLQCLEKTDKERAYGVSCDFWSLGILAYELTIGNTPFTGQNSTSVYAKIMNHNNTLKFPSDITLSQAYVDFVKSLLVDAKWRLNLVKILKHDLFKDTQFDSLREQVPPYVPKIKSVEDTSNFSDIQSKKKTPSINSFKKRTQFSGRNLPFIGFTFTHDPSNYDTTFDRKILAKDEVVEGLKKEVEYLTKKMVKNEISDHERCSLEKKLEEKTRKFESIESMRDKLERELASNIAEKAALKRTLELERKERADLEKKALDLIKSAKQKWEVAEKNKVESLLLELEQQKVRINQLTATNKMLNEQVQHALKLEDKHRESLETVQNLSRRSVLGLESRLEKVTHETQDTISELENKLAREQQHKKQLENKVSKLQEREVSLLNKIQQNEKEFESWKGKIDEAERIIKHLDHQVAVLETDIVNMDEYKEQVKELQDKVEMSQKMLKDMENRNTLLEMETRAMEGYKKEIEEMKLVVAKMQNDRRVAELESHLLEEKEKCESLKKQLQESENIVTDNQELKELRTKYWRLEKELDNAKIDKRILERELKDAKTEIKQLSDKIEEQNNTYAETKKASELALLELNGFNETLTLDLMKLTDANKNLMVQLNNEKEMIEGEKHLISELKDIARKKDEQLNSLSEKLAGLTREKTLLEKEIKTFDVERSHMMNLMDVSRKEKEDAQNELDQARREISNINLNLSALREACTLLESQVIEYEKLSASFETKNRSLNSNTEKLIQDLCMAKQEIQDAKKHANEEKSLKLFAETKLKRLNEDIESLQTQCETYRLQRDEYKEYSTKLSDDLNVTEEKISALEVKIKSLERQIDGQKSENRVIKQELTDYITQLNNLKETNYKLKNQLSEFKKNNMMLTQKLNETERILNEKSHYYREREMKSDSTIKQQIKLIDYLQTKIDEYSNKKRTFTEVLFGSSKKENQPPISLAMNYKDLEMQLLKEKQANKQLHEEIYKLKAATMIPSVEKIRVERHKSEILSPKSRIAMQQIVNSPSKQKNDLYRQHSVQRMHHNIPHRFESKLCTKTSKCRGCLEQISLGRSILVCSECHIQAHSNCLKQVPNTCGLPEMFAKHYTDSLQPKKEEILAEPLKTDEVVNVEGWIKLPGKSNGWEKYYACLTDTAINIYTGPTKDKTSKLIESFLLKPEGSHGKVISEPLASEIAFPVANSDMAFILKVEVSPNTTCWPPKCLIFLTLSAQDKDKWFLALQNIYYEDFDKLKFDLVLTVPEDLVVNCMHDLTANIIVLGTEKGLYSYYEKSLVKIDGLEELHQITIMNSNRTVIMIADKKRKLVICDLNHLINVAQCAECTKPKLKFTEINVQNLNGFNTLQVSPYPNQQKFCTATNKQLIIFDYNVEDNQFTPVRILDTAEPLGCALFTENSLIVGANKFFEIDLATFGAEEFLDISDARLKQAESCYKMGSFPLAILQISKNPKEYLLCFNEFAVFVDEYGRSTRQTEIKSNHLPLAFHFHQPYLYVVQFAAIEIIKITEETCNSIDNLEFTRLEIEKFRYIGHNKTGLYIACGREVKFVDAKKIVDCDLYSEVTESSAAEENESDRFSFSSSMIQSLDGNLSDGTESSDDKNRKVRFSQTDL